MTEDQIQEDQRHRRSQHARSMPVVQLPCPTCGVLMQADLALYGVCPKRRTR